ncbi:Uncharacterised protein [Mycoplasmopsis bovirhinis]|uniref:Uncharacterized protein n=2 Tax=Mycoplasmopsis bovirhinis TaxID=29553 RepID=A0A449AEC9_9BACT|nr:Uncharacterised protein [Mycoplasmopsis bovirhinis]
MDFFVQNKIKLNENYFNNLELVLKKYNKFINEVYLKKKRKVSFLTVLIILCIVILSVFSMIFFTEISTQFYLVRLISIFTIVIILTTNAFMQLKMNNNKFFIESNYYKELLTSWKQVNDSLPGTREFGEIYKHFIYKFKEKNIKLVINQGNKKIKLKVNTNYQTWDKSIFKTKEEWIYFLNVLPWNLINDKKEQNYEI